jgi:hypothetical protein
MDTDQLLDMMGSKESTPSEIHDAIKTLLTQKSADKVGEVTPAVAAGIFGDTSGEDAPANEVETETETETEEESE